MKRIALKKVALETLRHISIQRINFRYGSLSVVPQDFLRVAGHIEADRIVFAASHGNHYDPSPEAGQTHTIGVSSSLGRVMDGTMIAVMPFTPQNRGTIVHECCHATHDVQGVTAHGGNAIRPRHFEGAATLAGWIAALLWGYDRSPSPFLTPTMELALRKARAFLDGSIGHVIDQDTVRELDGAVQTGSANRYVFNGI